MDVVFFDCYLTDIHPHEFTIFAMRCETASIPPHMAIGKYGTQVLDEWTLYREGRLKVRKIRAIPQTIPK